VGGEEGGVGGEDLEVDKADGRGKLVALAVSLESTGGQKRTSVLFLKRREKCSIYLKI
jgi:hypothetical protein